MYPVIIAHGYKEGPEDHFALSMNMASHGYLCIGITFTDGSAPFTRGKDDMEIPFLPYAKEDTK